MTFKACITSNCPTLSQGSNYYGRAYMGIKRPVSVTQKEALLAKLPYQNDTLENCTFSINLEAFKQRLSLLGKLWNILRH